MNRIGFVLDPHLSSHNPSGRSDYYATACLDKLCQVMSLATDRQWDALAIAGDMFNISSAARWFENDVIRILMGSPCPVYAIAGNHDLKARRVNAIREIILGSLFESGVVRNLAEMPIAVPGLAVNGMHFYSEPSEHLPKAKEQNSWLVCHQYLGGESGLETLSYDEIKAAGYVGVIAGHEHADLGIQDKDGLKVVRCGSLLRKENAEFNYRIPRVAELGTGNTVRLFDIQAASSEEIFIAKRKGIEAEEVFDSERMKEFARNLESGGFLADGREDVTLMRYLTEERGLREGSEVHVCISEYFERNGIK